MMNGQDKYRRFARMIPTQEVQLAVDVAKAAKQRTELEKDLIEARERVSPKARKKRAAAKKARESSKSKNTERFEAKILEKSGTRDEQLSRLPRAKKDGNIRNREPQE